MRTLVRNLRVGANWRSVLSALGRAAVLFEATHPRPAACPADSTHAASHADAAAAHQGADAAGHAQSAGGNCPQAAGAAVHAEQLVAKAGDRSKEALDLGAAAAVDAFHRCPSLGRVIAAIRTHGVSSLEVTCGVATGIPLHPMLAKITEGFEDCVNQLTGQAALAEFKYDGQRAQIHVNEAGEVRLPHCASEQVSTKHEIIKKWLSRLASHQALGMCVHFCLFACSTCARELAKHSCADDSRKHLTCVSLCAGSHLQQALRGQDCHVPRCCVHDLASCPPHRCADDT